MTGGDATPTFLVGQSGGPTPVINASLAGLLDRANALGAPWRRILGLRHGIEGALTGNVIDLGALTEADHDALAATPASALGSCRRRIGAADEVAVLDAFARLGVRWFAYCGGNDSMDTLARLERAARARGQALATYGVPKTIDNDLAGTEWCPGYGSAARYWATVTQEVTCDLASMRTYDRVVVLEAMGRNAGWLAASSALWRRDDADGPHVLLVPERAFDEANFLARVEATVARVGYAVVMATETIKDGAGEYVARRSDGVDHFGHPLVAGTADTLAALVTARLSLKARVVKPGTAQRASVAHVSPVDRDGARIAGRVATSRLARGDTGAMVSMPPVPLDDAATLATKWWRQEADYGDVPLAVVAGAERRMPDGLLASVVDQDPVTEGFRTYAGALVGSDARTSLFRFAS
jgi:6-phosphofructokinase 1